MKKLIFAIAFFVFTIASVSSFAQDKTPLLELLRNNNFESLESSTKQLQSEFEGARITEIQIRNTYRQFYDLDENTLSKVHEWINKYPDSYAARLVIGTFYKRKGNDARGTAYIKNTPKGNIDKMRSYHKLAVDELNKSLKLTAKPFLSIFHLLDMAISAGDKAAASRLLSSANKMLPNNTLVRNRYMIGLTPRWGGSYREMDEFITRAKKERVNSNGIMQLEAIMYDDMGYSEAEAGRKSDSIEYYRKSLDLNKRIGGEFGKDFLKKSLKYGCSVQSLKHYCQ